MFATWVVAAVAAFTLAACGTPGSRAPDEARRALAPEGRLRVGLYVGSPTSIVGDPASPDAKGVAFDLGRDLARRLGVPFEAVVFPRNADLLAAAKAGRVDVVFTNATPARAADLDFSQTYLRVEQGYLVPPGSKVATMADVDRAGARVGVSVGSTSEGVMARELERATVVRTPSIAAAVQMLRDGRLDAFATNKAILFEMADEVPGARVLDGRWGTENFAAGIPKGREAGLPFLRECIDAMRADGTVARAVTRAGLRGTDAVGN